MEIEIINTGSEIMLGRILNTHQQWLCSQLANRGYVVTRQIAIADQALPIQNTLRESLARADLIITTGGLGPTSDDITRDLIAELLGKKLELDTSVLERLEKFFTQRQRRMPESTKVQAMIPAGARVMQNSHGTAPGLVMEINPNRLRTGSKPTWLVMLPGPPRELRPMFLEQVLPLIENTFPSENAFVCRTLKTTGMGESFVEEKISGRLRHLAPEKIELGYCARVGEVDVRLVARGSDAQAIVTEAEQIVREALGAHVFGVEDDILESTLIGLLKQRNETLAVAESCTGGFISHRLTNVPGSSAVFPNGLITYSNESKQRLLGVRGETLAEFGAVSETCAREMAKGVRARSKSDYGIAVTGIAGPGGGTKEKPVGTVFIAVATSAKTVVRHHVFQYDRETFKFVVSQQALDLVRREILAL
ncbi:MAG: competence/damage-inducible protein A [Verrucomicrobiota bacterium]